MTTLIQHIPDVDTLISLQPEELGRILLKLIATYSQNGIFNPNGITSDESLFGTHNFSGQQRYAVNRKSEVLIAVGEGWHWLELNMLIMPAPDINGRNGYKVLTRRGRELVNSPERFGSYASAAAFPKHLLHPLIREDVWLKLARGDYADAVFKAFRTVEEQVRFAGSYSGEKIGVDLMRLAFKPGGGPLAQVDDHKGEQEALMALFSGAIGTYKNPHSHRTVVMNDPGEAREMVILASLLLRIIEERAATNGAGRGA
jgi:uncharacterized protein (TIGR02391 family)